MNAPDLNPPAVSFKDRSTGLMVFGILTMLVGALCALLVPLMFFGQMMVEKSTNVPANYQAIIPGTLLTFYMFVWLLGRWPASSTGYCPALQSRKR